MKTLFLFLIFLGSQPGFAMGPLEERVLKIKGSEIERIAEEASGRLVALENVAKYMKTGRLCVGLGSIGSSLKIARGLGRFDERDNADIDKLLLRVTALVNLHCSN